MPSFTGFPPAAFSFYDELAVENTKAWFADHRQTYESAIREPMLALLADLADEFGEGKVFRPYKDARFARGDGGYVKDHQGGFIGVEEAVGYYLQVSAQGLMVAGGWYAPIGDQLSRFREVVDSAAGAELPALLEGVRTVKMEIDGNPLATRPRGVDPEHPRLEYLRMRRLVVSRTYPASTAWLSRPEAGKRVRSDWRAIAPVVEWLGEKVGPGEQPDFSPF